MSVYDKELIIDGKAVRSPEQQVYKNMKDIEELQKTIKPMYKTTDSTLTSSSVSVATANTNVGTADSGWLLDPNGLLFKVTANDGTTVTLQYYSDLKGPQGEDGAAVNIDDSITSLTKVWSSQKTNNEINGLIEDNSVLNNNKTYSQAYIGNIINNGIWYSTTQPAGSPLVINVTDIVVAQKGNAYCENTIQQGDMFFYVDNDLKASELYVIDDITSGVATVQKICDIGGGKQLYQHNIFFNNAYARLSGTSYTTQGTITIINDSNVPMTFESICQFLAQNDFKSAYADLGTNTKWYGNVNIETMISSSYKQNYGICTNNDITYWCVVQTWGSTGTISKTTTLDGVTYTINITDTVVEL